MTEATVYGALLLVCGLFGAMFPRASWFLSHGRHFKDAEPSDAALDLGRVGGIVAAFTGVVLLLTAD